VIRVAAVGDLHAGHDSVGKLRPHFEHVDEQADVLAIVGDLTRLGDPTEARVLADELSDVSIPKIAILGNHDCHSDKEDEIREVMEGGGFVFLEGEGVTLEIGEVKLGVAGAKGFGGGFPGASGSDFGEREMKAFMQHARDVAEGFGRALEKAEGDVRLALVHYSPVEDTLVGERLEIYPFLGCYFLAEAIDRAGADLVLHGHAHGGTEKGMTPGGVQVRNVAQPVIKRAYRVFCLSEGGSDEC
jgi:Icc-related predicted phosphoesterase